MADNKAKPTDITSKWIHDNAYDPSYNALRVAFASPYAVDDPVYLEDEEAPLETRTGMAVGGVDDTGVFKTASISPTGRLKVDADLTISNITVDVSLDHTNDSVAIGRSGVLAEVDADERLRVHDIETKNEVNELKDKLPSSFVTEKYDDLELTYVLSGAATGKISTATYKHQGVTVATVSLSYNPAGRLSRVQRL